MLTEDQLADQLRTQLRQELSAIEPGADLLPGVRRRQARRSRATRIGLVAVPGAAFAAAAALIAVSVAGGAAPGAPRPSAAVPGQPAVLTASMVDQVASQSRQALARSGKVTISYRTSYDGTFTGSGSDAIRFAGHNWNDSITQHFPAAGGTPAHTQTAINRVVNGQLYLHIAYLGGPDGDQVRWYHDTNPNGHPKISVHDPRTLFRLLNPTAKFQVIGHRQVGGTRLTGLRATASPMLRPLSWLPAEPGSHVTALTVWVDAHHVVHQMSLRLTKTVDPLYYEKSVVNGQERIKIVIPDRAYLAEAQAMARKMQRYHATVSIDPSRSARTHLEGTDIAVTFAGFGQTQVIPVPPHAVPMFTRG